jgi:hypothetical protein
MLHQTDIYNIAIQAFNLIKGSNVDLAFDFVSNLNLHPDAEIEVLNYMCELSF